MTYESSRYAEGTPVSRYLCLTPHSKVHPFHWPPVGLVHAPLLHCSLIVSLLGGVVLTWSCSWAHSLLPPAICTLRKQPTHPQGTHCSSCPMTKNGASSFPSILIWEDFGIKISEAHPSLLLLLRIFSLFRNHKIEEEACALGHIGILILSLKACSTCWNFAGFSEVFYW